MTFDEAVRQQVIDKVALIYLLEAKLGQARADLRQLVENLRELQRIPDDDDPTRVVQLTKDGKYP